MNAEKFLIVDIIDKELDSAYPDINRPQELEFQNGKWYIKLKDGKYYDNEMVDKEENQHKAQIIENALRANRFRWAVLYNASYVDATKQRVDYVYTNKKNGVTEIGARYLAPEFASLQEVVNVASDLKYPKIKKSDCAIIISYIPDGDQFAITGYSTSIYISKEEKIIDSANNSIMIPLAKPIIVSSLNVPELAEEVLLAEGDSANMPQIVHGSVSEAIKKLFKSHSLSFKEVCRAYEEIKRFFSWEKPDFILHQDVWKAASRGFERSAVFKIATEPGSEKNAQWLLALVWLAIKDISNEPMQSTTKETLLSPQDTAKKKFVYCLYEIQREYNLDKNGKDDFQGEDKYHFPLSSEAMNKMVEVLNTLHPDVNIDMTIFSSFKPTPTQPQALSMNDKTLSVIPSPHMKEEQINKDKLQEVELKNTQKEELSSLNAKYNFPSLSVSSKDFSSTNKTNTEKTKVDDNHSALLKEIKDTIVTKCENDSWQYAGLIKYSRYAVSIDQNKYKVPKGVWKIWEILEKDGISNPQKINEIIKITASRGIDSWRIKTFFTFGFTARSDDTKNFYSKIYALIQSKDKSDLKHTNK